MSFELAFNNEKGTSHGRQSDLNFEVQVCYACSTLEDNKCSIDDFLEL